MGTVISKNPIPLTAVFKFFMGSPAKLEITTVRAPIPILLCTPIVPYPFSRARGLPKIVRVACPLFRARHG